MPQLTARSPQQLASALLAFLMLSIASGCATTSSAGQPDPDRTLADR
jgi:hypothetical protein